MSAVSRELPQAVVAVAAVATGWQVLTGSWRPSAEAAGRVGSKGGAVASCNCPQVLPAASVVLFAGGHHQWARQRARIPDAKQLLFLPTQPRTKHMQAQDETL